MAENTKTLLDAKETIERLAGDEDLFGEIAEIIIRTAPPQIEAVHAVLADTDLKRAREAVRSLKGSVAAFVAPEVLNSLAIVARHVESHDFVAATEAFAKAESLVQQLLGELASHVRTA